MLLGIIALMTMGAVDAYFVAQLGTLELAAVSFALPVTQILINVSLGMGMAISATASRLLGQQDQQQAATLISDGIILCMLITAACSFAGYVFLDPLFRLLGAGDDTLPFIADYMIIWYWGAPILVITITGSSSLRSIGNTDASAMVVALLSILNIVFDPIFIFGLGPIPAMGVQGAAIASLLAATASSLLALYWLSWKEAMINWRNIRWRRFCSSSKVLLPIGIPAIGANVMTPLAAAIMTAIVATQGSQAVAGFGVGSRIESLSLIVVFALSSTLPMFIGQNLGAGKQQRAWRAIKGTLLFSLAFQALVYIVLFFGATAIAELFSDDATVIRVIEQFLFILPATYGAHGVVILIMVSLNVLHRPKVALAITLIRLAALYLPLAYIGSNIGGLPGLFAGAAIGNIIAAAVAYMTLIHAANNDGLRTATD